MRGAPISISNVGKVGYKEYVTWGVLGATYAVFTIAHTVVYLIFVVIIICLLLFCLGISPSLVSLLLHHLLVCSLPVCCLMRPGCYFGTRHLLFVPLGISLCLVCLLCCSL